ncbi:hypothetical protein HPB49_026041 [Dermacentor silvarum]|nr:hypothetical protein HPB49_026041 [Dermacentor silvarum]
MAVIINAQSSLTSDSLRLALSLTVFTAPKGGLADRLSSCDSIDCTRSVIRVCGRDDLSLPEGGCVLDATDGYLLLVAPAEVRCRAHTTPSSSSLLRGDVIEHNDVIQHRFFATRSLSLF